MLEGDFKTLKQLCHVYTATSTDLEELKACTLDLDMKMLMLYFNDVYISNTAVGCEIYDIVSTFWS